MRNDNCNAVANANQLDSDGDGIGACACGRRVHLPSMTSLAVRLSACSFLCTFSFQVTCATTAPFAATQRKVRLGEKFCLSVLLTLRRPIMVFFFKKKKTNKHRFACWKVTLTLPVPPPSFPSVPTVDSDADTVGNDCDNCKTTSNTNQVCCLCGVGPARVYPP